MNFLPEGTNNTTTVTFEDQQKINKFSTLISHFDRLQDELKILENEKEQIDDVSLELELVDEDELIDYHIGGNSLDGVLNDGCFVKIKQEKVLPILEEKSSKIEQEMTAVNEKISEINESLSKIKSELYAKFGNAINLER